ncbi:MAG: hypothetical protein K2M91_03615 [Lachnospiraceae bacterium]|nr:hypothetical protein [Lachnospiraceae bacterium]
MNNYLKAFIPQHIGNKTVLTVYSILRRITNGISEKRIRQNAVSNMRELYSSGIYFPFEDSSGSVSNKIRYIENQSEWENVWFGNGKKSTIAHSGCGIIAAYNALAALHVQVSPDVMVELISSFERDGAALGGRFGVAPGAIYDYFLNKGYEIVMTSEKSAEKLDSLGEKYSVFIVTAYNDEQDITAMVHTVCMTKAEDHTFVIHNGYYRDAGSGRWDEKRTKMQTLADAISKIGKKSAAISVIGLALGQIRLLFTGHQE